MTRKSTYSQCRSTLSAKMADSRRRMRLWPSRLQHQLPLISCCNTVFYNTDQCRYNMSSHAGWETECVSRGGGVKLFAKLTAATCVSLAAIFHSQIKIPLNSLPLQIKTLPETAISANWRSWRTAFSIALNRKTRRQVILQCRSFQGTCTWREEANTSRVEYL